MPTSPVPRTSSDDGARPHWDGTGRLSLGRLKLREFRRLATSQAPILAALEAAGWPLTPIPNPLPPEHGETAIDLGCRLHETVKNLNRKMTRNTIRFRDDRVNVWWVRVRRGQRK